MRISMPGIRFTQFRSSPHGPRPALSLTSLLGTAKAGPLPMSRILRRFQTLALEIAWSIVESKNSHANDYANPMHRPICCQEKLRKCLLYRFLLICKGGLRPEQLFLRVELFCKVMTGGSGNLYAHLLQSCSFLSHKIPL